MGRDDKGRFEKGTSGNPAGKPTSAFSLMAIAIRVMQEENRETGKQYAEELIRNYIMTALENNDGTAVRDLIDRINGKAMQRMSVANDKDAEWLELFSEIKDEVDAEATDDSKA